jgi:protein transport protein SEC31
MGPPPVRPQQTNNPQSMAAPTGRQQPVKPPQGPPQGPPPPGRPPIQPPRGQAPPPAPQRPPLRPAELPELPDGLSDVEQKLLRQLHEELAQREDNGLPAADQPPQRMFRNTNGGGRPPQRPMGPPEGN